MKILTELGKELFVTDSDKIKLDHTVKSILSHKPLLSRILKGVVEECRILSLDEIEACIEGDVYISNVCVDDGLSNVGERIEGLGTESYFNSEGLNVYDIRTYIKIPDKTKQNRVKIMINIEAQNEDKPGYDIPLRALFYCCRMISAQQGVEFTTVSDDPIKYGNIKKVYSIWICTETAQKRANSIEKYDIQRNFIVGTNDDKPRYDILSAILINISEKHEVEGTESELIRLLTDLFDERIDGREKVEKLKSEYDLRLTKEVEKEVEDMCTYATAMENKGIEKGEERGIEKGLKALVNSLKEYIKDFEDLYAAVIRNEEYKDVTRDAVRKYYSS